MLRVGAAVPAATTRAGAVLQRPLSLAGLDLEARLRLQGEVAFRARSLGSPPREEPQPRGGATVSTLWEIPRPQGRNAI